MKWVVAGLFALLAGCAAQVQTIDVTPTGAASRNDIWAQLRALRLAEAVDDRGRGATELGRFYSLGSAARELHTSIPLAAVVRESFDRGLRARGALTSEAAAPMGTVHLLNFYVDKLVRREANVEVRFTVSDEKGLPIFSKEYDVVVVEGAVADTPKMLEGDLQDLRAIAELVLRQVTDKALDDPALHAALRRQ